MICLGLFLAPNALSCWICRDNINFRELLGSSLLSAALICLPFTIGHRTGRWSLALLSPFLVLMPGVIYSECFTGIMPSKWQILLIIEHTPEEAQQFILPLTLCMLVGILCMLAVLMIIWRCRPSFPGGLLPVRFFVLGILILFAIKDWRMFGLRGLTLEHQLCNSRFEFTFPWGVVSQISGAKRLSVEADSRKNYFTSHGLGAVMQPSNDPHLIIWVIGETTRYHNLSINGYTTHKTTPRLEKHPEITSFSNVTSPAALTHLSVPLMLTNADIRDYAADINIAARLPSVLTAFREVGWEVKWFSTQLQQGPSAGRSSMFSSEASESFFLNRAVDNMDVELKLRLDGELLPLVDKAIAERKGNLLIVLHTMGSHSIYQYRYPPEFNVFSAPPATTNRLTRQTVISDIDGLIRAYDNTIYYFDYFLDELLTRVNQHPGAGALFYVSDHGENLLDTPEHYRLHGQCTEFDLHVPLLVALSPGAQKRYPQKNQVLRAYQDIPFSSTCLFSSLLDFADIRYPGEDLTKSFLSQKFKPGPRLVVNSSGRVMDFDKDVKKAPR
jgi:glucan phosphoethanolaminetransferase (alkaline phosphatase superfamily)